MILKKDFYNQSAVEVARKLLGCYLVRRIDGAVYKTRIVETEAYEGLDDLASHASHGLTPRNSIMFGEPGNLYVYLTYGMHFMMNVVTGPKGYPAAVLFRAVEPSLPNPTKKQGGTSALDCKTNGPGRLTRALRIDREFNGLPVYVKKHNLWLESGDVVEPHEVGLATRVGIDYAGEYRNKLWRFYIKGSPSVSKI